MAANEAIQIAARHHRAGEFAEAEKIYRQILAQNPDHADALHMLGVLAMQTGRLDAAVDLIRQAIRILPRMAEAHSNLGSALKRLGRFEEAIASYREAVRLKPDLAETYDGLGSALMEVAQFDEAIAAFRQAIRLKPDHAGAHNNLGNALKDKGKLDKAAAAYRQATHLNEGLFQAHNNLGNVLRLAGQLDDATAAFQRAIQLKPDYAEAYNNLGAAFNDKGQLDDAVAAFRNAIRLAPDLAKAHNNLGHALKDMGELDEVIASYRHAICLQPAYSLAHSNLIFALHFHPGFDAKTIFEQHRLWNQQHAQPLRKFIRPHLNDRNPDRKLRIGYVSPDFCEHPVGRFLLPLLQAHDTDRFTVFCYSGGLRHDRLTEMLRQRASQWRNTFELTDERMAQTIREDQIDILIDLTMHSAQNRMLLFARKPAPVQVTYLAYCSTTGLDAMDYRLTDPHLDPPGMNDAYYSEKSIHLPETYWCYPLDDHSPQVSPLPALLSGEVTFGCLNNFCKVSPGALDLWIQLLRAVPKSRLTIHAHEGSHRQRVRDVLQNQGIDPQRLSFLAKVPLPEYFKLYHQIDISLDPFLCNGGTTTCDSMWMGVPVVTLTGQTTVGRGGVSVLRNIGLPELIAETPQQYLQIAVSLANDLPRLASLRRTLRSRMRSSPLMDAPRFARNIEAAYRQMWRNWCSIR